MKTTKQVRRGAKELFRATLVNGVMDPVKVRQVVEKVVTAKPRGYIAILENFKRLVKLEQDRRAAKVESAVPLDAQQQARISASLQKIYGAGFTLTFEQNPSLIAGLRVRVGSDVYDSSVASRLENLAESF